METVVGVIGVLIMIIIGMLFGRIMELAGLIFEAIIKLIRKLFWKLYLDLYSLQTISDWLFLYFIGIFIGIYSWKHSENKYEELVGNSNNKGWINKL